MDEALSSRGLGDRLRPVPSPPDLGFPGRASTPIEVGDIGARWRLVESHLLTAIGLTARRRVRWGLSVALVALVYFGAALAGNALKLTGNVDAVWPPAGVGIAAIYLGGLSLLPGVLVGDILADVLPGGLPITALIGQTFGNMLEVVVAAMLLRRLVRHGSPLDRLDGIARLLIAVLAGVAISATVGPISLFLSDAITSGELPGVMRTWFIGDSCGALIVVPLALAWLPLRPRPFNGRNFEAALALTATVVLTEVGLRVEANGPVMFLVFPALIWAALRLGARGGTLAVLVTVALTIRATAHQVGPFVVHSITNEVLGTQLYVAAAVVSTLVLVAIVAEREHFAERLNASRMRIVEAANAERRRLERDLHDGAQQRLTALSMHLNGLQHAAAREGTGELLRHLSSEVSLAIDELRELAHGIHPKVLTDFGLERAVENMAARSHVPVKVVAFLPKSERVDETAESTAYFVIAESLANAERHSQCTAIRVRIALLHGVLNIRVADDGVGGAAAAPGSGLEGLRDRVETAGGSFHVISVTGGGTHVHAAIPVRSIGAKPTPA
jgi:signal transduction histidine kinase